jgi:transcriptional regulator with XRE-family HTH domain
VVDEPVDGASGQTEMLAIEELGRLVRERREHTRQSVRQAAQEAGVSFATLARVEDGSQPDFVTFMKLCAWLGRRPSSFFRSVAERPADHLEEALKHLAADPRLPAEAAERIGSVVRDLYDLHAQDLPSTAVMDLHLRAAPIMRTGVPELLVGILTDMRKEMAERIARGEL